MNSLIFANVSFVVAKLAYHAMPRREMHCRTRVRIKMSNIAASKLFFDNESFPLFSLAP
jgi:hypothetical protein